MAGRPRKQDPLSKPLAVRFRVKEVAELDLFAAAADQTVSEYIRSSALREHQESGVSAILKRDIFRLLLKLELGLRDGLPRETLAGMMKDVLGALQ